jgi:DNA-binding transcriptional ArsR family regulator
VDAALKALAEQHRREILQLVAGRERSAGEIAAHFDISQPAVSQHLKVLREAGLVSERRAGQRRLYSLRPEGFADLRAFLESYWAGGLARLKDEVERETRSTIKGEERDATPDS